MKILLWLIFIFGRLTVSSVPKCGLFLNFWFSLDTCGLFQLAKRDIPYKAPTLYLPSEDQISEENILWLSSLNSTDISYNGESQKILEMVYVDFVWPKMDSF